MVVVVWVVFAVNFFWTLGKRNEKNLYVALWFYIATIVTVAVLYIVNNLALPTGLFHSYSLYPGVQDALVQWWYGHNAVAFFLTTPILGIMYYFLPKAAERPVYSYRLSIVHFWTIVFLYIWAGPHHLLNTSLPDWAQTLGMVFSLMLWAPSWGGMLNGLLTLRGAWDKLRTDPVIKFFAVAVTFYGMATFEGPLLSIKSVNGLGHYTDWIIGHVHGGTLGWNGFMAAGMLYWLVPRLWGTTLKSVKMADMHFYLGTFGILIYMGAMWVSGVSQGLAWRALDADGFLKYVDFIETLPSRDLLYLMRLIGGGAYLVGHVLMMWNLFATMKQGKPVNSAVEVIVVKEPGASFWKLIFAPPVLASVLIVGGTIALGMAGVLGSVVMLVVLEILVIALIVMYARSRSGKSWHEMIEAHPLAFTVLTLVAVLIGGIVELVPTIVVQNQVASQALATEQVEGEYNFVQQPYSPLELAGRDIYVREGCYLCHSQMIRPFRHETLRYGEPSQSAEFIYDRPFQWGSKRTGPDLHREGGVRGNSWHYLHLVDPRSTSPGSNMPPYAFLRDGTVEFESLPNRLEAMKSLGVPYTDDDLQTADAVAASQASLIVDDLAVEEITLRPDAEMTALIAYLQRLGRGPQPIAPELATGGK
jgi:cytochrome c oxidase cbb3-type subunit I/II